MRKRRHDQVHGPFEHGHGGVPVRQQRQVVAVRDQHALGQPGGAAGAADGDDVVDPRIAAGRCGGLPRHPVLQRRRLRQGAVDAYHALQAGQGLEQAGQLGGELAVDEQELAAAARQDVGVFLGGVARVDGQPHVAGADDAQRGGKGEQVIGRQRADLAVAVQARGAQAVGDAMGHVLDLPVAERAPAGFDETGFGQAVAGASIESVDQLHGCLRSAIRCRAGAMLACPGPLLLSAATTIGKRFPIDDATMPVRDGQ